MAEIRDELFYKQKNGYDTMSTQQRIDMEDYCRGYMAFFERGAHRARGGEDRNRDGRG